MTVGAVDPSGGTQQQLWTPWRFDYVTSPKVGPECLFCWLGNGAASDRERLLLYRGELNFVVINRYPYNNDHLMVARLPTSLT